MSKDNWEPLEEEVDPSLIENPFLLHHNEMQQRDTFRHYRRYWSDVIHRAEKRNYAIIHYYLFRQRYIDYSRWYYETHKEAVLKRQIAYKKAKRKANRKQ